MTTATPLRTEEHVERELTELLFRVKMLEFELRRMRDPRGPTFSDPVGPGDVEWDIAAARAGSAAKVEATLL